MCFMKAEDFKAMGLADVLAGLERDGFAIGLVDPEDYQGWKREIPGCVSKSMLHDFGQNALRFHLNEVEGRKVEHAGFRVGSAVDAAVLTPGLFSRRYWYEPKKVAITKSGEPAKNGAQDPEQKAAWAAREAAGNVMLSEKELAQVMAMAENVNTHLAELGMTVGYNTLTQVAMFVRIDSVGGERLPVPLVVSGMLDLMPLEGRVLWDLKTTSRGVDETGLNYAMCDYGYGIQAALYADLFAVCTGEEREFAFLFVESSAPYQSRVVRMPWLLMEGYRARYERLLREYSRCLSTGDWGALILPEMVYSPPKFEAVKLAELG